MSTVKRLRRIEQSLGPPPCAECRDWPPDLDAFFRGDEDPWRWNGNVHERHCPSCGRKPPVTKPLQHFLAGSTLELLWD